MLGPQFRSSVRFYRNACRRTTSCPSVPVSERAPRFRKSGKSFAAYLFRSRADLADGRSLLAKFLNDFLVDPRERARTAYEPRISRFNCHGTSDTTHPSHVIIILYSRESLFYTSTSVRFDFSDSVSFSRHYLRPYTYIIPIYIYTSLASTFHLFSPYLSIFLPFSALLKICDGSRVSRCSRAFPRRAK